jgi:hypothetical protein
MDVTGMDSATMKNILGSMLFAKDMGILAKLPKSRVIDDAHVITIDSGFRSPSNVRLDAGCRASAAVTDPAVLVACVCVRSA